jgi:hypothetical protein
MSTIQFAFVLIDHTTSATPDALKPAPAFERMTAAWLEQIEGPFADAYGEQCVSFRIAANESDRQANEIAINFRDTIPEAPGALAYHTVVNGIPDIELGVDLFSDLTTTQESVSSGGSHELLELLQDIGANEWADRQDASGEMDAKESCDFVQNTGYAASNGVWLSNFVLPSFFIPQAPGPWDDMGVMTSQYDVSNGYGIQGNSPNNITQIGGAKLGLATHRGRSFYIVGNLTEVQRKRKSHPYSRTYRRGVRLGAIAAPESFGKVVVP